MDHPSAPCGACLDSHQLDTVAPHRALSRHGCRTCDETLPGHGLLPATRSVAHRRSRFRLHAGQAARDGPLRGAARPAGIPAERVRSSTPLASAMGFRPHQRTRSGATNPCHAKLAGRDVL